LTQNKKSDTLQLLDIMKNLDIIIDNLLEGFSEKQEKVLAGRFGLKTGKKATLQEIGDSLGVTRERVRQIEVQSLKKLKKLIENDKSSKDIISATESYLKTQNGVSRADELLKQVIKKASLKAKKNAEEKLFFILSAAGIPRYRKENDNFRAYWYSDPKSEKKFLDFIKGAIKFFKQNKKQDIIDKKLYRQYTEDKTSQNFLSISKHFSKNMFGDLGLADWPEINPKTIRDKAYLALKKDTTPLHFEEIAKKIGDLGIDKRPAHVQTVHNELIKDSRFVLVGRGMYALEEHGYEPGTVREVITKLFQEKGPLSSSEVIKLVNERRFLKENTILLNLQNRRYFTRLKDGKYHVKRA